MRSVTTSLTEFIDMHRTRQRCAQSMHATLNHSDSTIGMCSDVETVQNYRKNHILLLVFGGI